MGKGFAVHWWQPLIAGNVMGSKIVTNVRVYINNCKAVITHSALRILFDGTKTTCSTSFQDIIRQLRDHIIKSAMFLGKLRPFLKSRFIILREFSDSSSERVPFYSMKPRFMYRDYIERDFKEERKSQLLMTLFWAWITYFCINHPEELIGHEKLPDPKTFTDNELGVL
ncbi:unnamed protein product [Schistosoma rodhaini]|nr:unnamed protein product [Schistosoma rodhaini]